MSTAQLSPGTVVDGKFTIGEPGRTRAGASTHAATDPQGQAVVVTVYDASCFPSNLMLERSLRELRQLQSLQSERVAPVLACGKLPEGGIYEVNAPLPSQRLDEMMANGALAAPEASALITQVGEGLLEAQKAGVIHRNLGPRVIFVGSEGVVLTGFAVGEPHGDKSFGPLDTIAPEQVQGKVVDQRTLIYNLAALMHMLLQGAALFSGDGAAQMEAHLSAELPAEVHARLKRALGKDPRMRPMMLKQFISELRAIGGSAARAPMAPSAKGGKAPPMPGESSAGKAGGPSSRGWTMFMKEDGSSSEPSGSKAPPTPGSGAPKPKTRGWTMFMEAADEEPKKKAEEAAPKPSTRGWTMFMEDDEAEGGASDAAAEPAAEAKAPEPAAEDGSKPKTRGWTMFMEAEESDEAKAAAEEPAAEEPAAEEPAAEPDAGAAPPSVGGDAPKPSTRGWTMFMKAEDSDEAKAASDAPSVSPPAAKAPAVSAPSVSPPAAKAPGVSPPSAGPTAPSAGGDGGAPPSKSRGWTMFMEPAGGGATPPSADAPSEAPEVAAPPAPEEEAPVAVEAEVEAEAGPPVEATPGKREGDAPAKKRGWTMFMDKPISDSNDDELGGVVKSPGESSAKGWTVFSPAADGEAGEAAQAAPAEAPAGEEAPPPSESPAPVAAEMESPVVEAPPPEQPRSKTVVASTGPQPEVPLEPEAQAPPQSAARAARGRTVVAPPGSGPAAANPMATPGADAGPPSGPVSGPISGPVSGPVSGQMAPIAPQAVEPAKKSNTAVFAVIGVVVVVVVIVAIVLTSS